MQVADVRNAAHDGLAVEFEHEAQDAVRGGMLRPDVDEHVLAFELQRRRLGDREAGVPAKDTLGDERNPLRAALLGEAARREFDFDRAFGGHDYSPVFSPDAMRARMSSGSSSKASATFSSSIEYFASGLASSA